MNKAMSAIDKVFNKKSYDYYAVIQKVSREFTSNLTQQEIYKLIGDTLSSALGLKNISLLSYVPDSGYITVYSASENEANREEAVKISGNSGLIRLLETSQNIIVKDELSSLSEAETTDDIKDTFALLGGKAIAPVFIDDRLELLLVLGERLYGGAFAEKDISLINTISNQTAAALKAAWLYQEKVRSERLASIGMMSAIFAHEVRTSLTSIKTFAQLIPERYADVDFRENFSKIMINSVHRIDSLIKDLLDYSSDKIFIEMKSLDITELIEHILDDVRTGIDLAKRNIVIAKDYKKSKINMLGDEKRLRQAFLNIIHNGCQAIPFSRTDGVLTVRIEPDRENVNISISDNGDGILPENIPRIFEPFFTVKASGTGLGLPIAKKVIENHSGKIAVESRPKEGTTFTVILPARAE